MPSVSTSKQQTSALHEINSDEVQDIVTAVPSWILRRGISLVFLILISIIALTAFVQYPDVIRTELVVSSLNTPKVIYAKQTGKIVSILLKEGREARQGQPIAFMESTARHRDVLQLSAILQQLNAQLISTGTVSHLNFSRLNLGELQAEFQVFYPQYLRYLSTQSGGYYLRNRNYLQSGLEEIRQIGKQIDAQQQVQEREFANIKQEFQAYQKLYKKGVISNSEYKQQENKYLSAQYPLQRSATELLNNKTAYAAKQQEIVDLEHVIQDEKANFVQHLNNMITGTNAWVKQYILTAPISGTLSYAGIIQQNQNVNLNDELFVINPGRGDFFGQITIPQYNMGKVRTGQLTLIKLRSFPFEQFGMIRGEVSFVSDVPINDSIFLARVRFGHFENTDHHQKIVLKHGMRADAEIITEKSSLLMRLFRNFRKMLHKN